jgi:hypothetical protein
MPEFGLTQNPPSALGAGEQAPPRPARDLNLEATGVAREQEPGHDLHGYWALLVVRVKDLDQIDNRIGAEIRQFLASRLGEILNARATVYQTLSGIAVLVGPNDDLYKTQYGASLLKKAVSGHLAHVGLNQFGISEPTYTFNVLCDELPPLRGRLKAFK